MQTFDRENLIYLPDEWFYAEKKVKVRMQKIEEPFHVETPHGTVTANPGDYLAVDEAGYPYPIAQEIFEMSYEKVK